MRTASIVLCVALAACSGGVTKGKEAPSCSGQVRDLNPEDWDRTDNELGPASPASRLSRMPRA